MAQRDYGPNELVIIVPTRGRPKAMTEFLADWRATTGGRSRVVVCVDDDDPTLGEYLAGPLADHPDHLIGPRLSLAGWTNKVAVACVPSAYAVASLGDDHRVVGGWEADVLDALHGLGTGIVYGDDGLQGVNRPTAVFMSADIVAALGWMCFPGAEHMEIDVVWMTMGKAAGCLRYLPHVSTPHLHPLAGKGDWDDSYRESNSNRVYLQDMRAHLNFLYSGGFDDAVAKIQALRGER